MNIDFSYSKKMYEYWKNALFLNIRYTKDEQKVLTRAMTERKRELDWFCDSKNMRYSPFPSPLKYSIKETRCLRSINRKIINSQGGGPITEHQMKQWRWAIISKYKKKGHARQDIPDWLIELNVEILALNRTIRRQERGTA